MMHNLVFAVIQDDGFFASTIGLDEIALAKLASEIVAVDARSKVKDALKRWSVAGDIPSAIAP